MRVLVTDNLAEEGLEVLRGVPGLELVVSPGLVGSELRAALAAADGIIIRSGTKLDGETLAQPGKLRAIVRAGVGVDNIEVPAATRRGIVVMNTPGGNTVSTAEHTVAMLMALSRNIPQANASLREGRWDRKLYTGTQLAGKTIGLIGLGRVGMAVARRALGLEMRVLGFDPFLPADQAKSLGVEPVADIEQLLPVCDFLSIHTHLTDQTRGLIGAERLRRMKRGVRILNCARGGLIDEDALAEAVAEGHVAGAALDVFAEEPPGDHRLLKSPNVIATPHLGASTTEAQVSVAIEAARLMAEFLTEGRVGYAVNTAPLDREQLSELGLYLDMAHRLGLLHAQMSSGTIRAVRVKYRGEITEKNTKLVTAALAAGLLDNALAENVNLINSPIIARERGIQIQEESSTEQGDFSTVIHVDVDTETNTYRAAGTIFGKQFLRLVRLGDYHLDAYLDGTLLVFSHRDVPGIIGSIGTIFGKHNVNIAAMTVGRSKPGGEAIAVLNLDSLPTDEALKEVLQHEKVTSAKVVQLPPVGVLPDWLAAAE